MNNTKKLTSGQIMLFAAGTLFCLMLISVSLMSGLYARYTTSGSGSDDAGVAKFDVTATVPGNIDVTFADTEISKNIYTITVTNKSEVAVRYDVVLEFNTDIPDYLTVSLSGVDESQVTREGKVITFKNVADLVSNTGVDTRTLTFAVDGALLTDGETGESVSADFTFNGTVKCVQID